jgi:hypothetical protein
MDLSPSDITFLLLVLGIIMAIIMNDSDWGSGRRARVGPDLATARCQA